jgi:isoleucyl-tRNA synthetase
MVFSKLIAPIAPFISEEIYLNLKQKYEPESVHLSDFPEITDREKKLKDKALEDRMGMAQKVVSIVRSLRNDQQIRVRQPLSELSFFVKSKQQKDDIQQMHQIICEEVNVKKIRFVENENDLVVKSAKPNFKVLGGKVGKLMGQLGGIIKAFSVQQINEIESEGHTNVYIDGHEMKLTTEDVEISAHPKENLAVYSETGLVIGLNLELTDVLIEEGLAREFVNRVQNFRKEAGFDVTDHIVIEVQDILENMRKAISNQKTYICNETLADEINFDGQEARNVFETKIESETIKIGLIKNS